MLMDCRSFEVVSRLTGECCQVEFRWLQTAISLRHSDTVDVQFAVNGAGRIVALPHGALEQACHAAGVPLGDDLCIRIAAECLRESLEAGEDPGSEPLTVAPKRVAELVDAQPVGHD